MALTSTQLALLVEIEHTGSLARAALTLGVSPPAVSQQLARLEKEVGAPLVDRGARGTRLTSLGLALAAHGRTVSEELRRADESAAEFVGAHANRLRVGAPPSVGVGLLPDVLAAVRFKYPAAELSVVDTMSDAGYRLVADGVLDLALTADYGQQATDDRTRVVHLLTDPMLVVFPDDHELARRAPGSIEMADLEGETWVSGPPGRPSRSQLDDAAAECGFVPHVPFRTESYDLSQALTQAGVALSLIPRLALTGLPQCVAIPLSSGLAREVYAVLPSSAAHVPLAGDFLARLGQVTAQLE